MNNTRDNKNAKETTRVEAFSDGVFAIAITLLVLELISILHADRGVGLLKTCLDHWQSFVAFTIGFITILVCWINHHIAVEYIVRVDTKFMWVNGFLLFVITLTPFPTAILAEYFETESTLALAMFGANYILISIAAYSICAHAYKHHLIGEEYRNIYHSYKTIYRYSILYTLVAFIVCFISIGVAIALYVILFVVFAAPKEFASKLYRRRLQSKNK